MPIVLLIVALFMAAPLLVDYKLSRKSQEMMAHKQGAGLHVRT